MDICKLFENICVVKKCFKDPFVMEALKASGVTGALDLSGFSVSVKLCEVIECVLTKSQDITKIKLCDCMISADGFDFIINALMHHPYITEVNLYGNNIKGDITKKLGKMLEGNTKIKVLILNWNNIGQSLEAFGVFCEGLSKNESLEYLDLRNNQLTSQCASYLSAALLENHSLKMLDLRWNKLQNEGIECLQGALKQNKNLIEVYLKGNFAQSKITEKVEECTKRNEEIEALKMEYESKIAFLLKEVKKLEEGRLRQISKITELAHQKIIELEIKVENIMEKLLKKDEQLKIKEKEQSKTQAALLQEKEKRIESMEELEIVKKINLELKENLRLKDIELHKCLQENEAELLKERELQLIIKKELKEKDKLINELREQIKCLDEKWEDQLKIETDKLEHLWKTRLREMETKFNDEMEIFKGDQIKAHEILINEQQREIESLRETNKDIDIKRQSLEEETASWKRKVDELNAEVSDLKKSLTFISELLNTVKKELKNEKLKYKKMKEGSSVFHDELRNLNEVVKRLQKDLEIEKEKVYETTQKLQDANNRLAHIREEEKMRSELLTSALKRYLSLYDAFPLV